jgi:hypothetical protein
MGTICPIHTASVTGAPDQPAARLGVALAPQGPTAQTLHGPSASGRSGNIASPSGR